MKARHRRAERFRAKRLRLNGTESKSKSRLLTLPREVRDIIIAYVLEESHPPITLSDGSQVDMPMLALHMVQLPALLWTHPQLGAETAEIFFSKRDLMIVGQTALLKFQRILRISYNAWAKSIRYILFAPNLSSTINPGTIVRELSQEAGLDGKIWVAGRTLQEMWPWDYSQYPEEEMVFEVVSPATGEVDVRRVAGASQYRSYEHLSISHRDLIANRLNCTVEEETPFWWRRRYA
jgi:8-oxo-dGTP pyrophosphatase MutT (NUDIX family)